MKKEGLFSGEVQSTFTVQDLVDMYKIGWRSVEILRVRSPYWAPNNELEKDALDHIQTLLRTKMDAICGAKPSLIIHDEPELVGSKVTLSIVPPEAPANEN